MFHIEAKDSKINTISHSKIKEPIACKDRKSLSHKTSNSNSFVSNNRIDVNMADNRESGLEISCTKSFNKPENVGTGNCNLKALDKLNENPSQGSTQKNGFENGKEKKFGILKKILKLIKF